MTDHTAANASEDAVPEADQLDQNLDVAPEESELEPAVRTADREAAEADLLEQSIPVPLDDEYEEPGSGY
ncbi:hypothetical protein [Nocardia spumae]|uniref:hypothetical protein n=1 Tax=Nocardia spumae TaxID=2887190 RepID=UPI001D14AB1B|nr:hypothetical protein [Nocardia spumae]